MTAVHGLDATDRLELVELYARYTHAFDDGRAERTFTPFPGPGTQIPR